jgi:hypothetical protein
VLLQVIRALTKKHFNQGLVEQSAAVVGFGPEERR